jgi:hypothetical protein
MGWNRNNRDKDNVADFKNKRARTWKQKERKEKRNIIMTVGEEVEVTVGMLEHFERYVCFNLYK